MKLAFCDWPVDIGACWNEPPKEPPPLDAVLDGDAHGLLGEALLDGVGVAVLGAVGAGVSERPSAGAPVVGSGSAGDDEDDEDGAGELDCDGEALALSPQTSFWTGLAVGELESLGVALGEAELRPGSGDALSLGSPPDGEPEPLPARALAATEANRAVAAAVTATDVRFIADLRCARELRSVCRPAGAGATQAAARTCARGQPPRGSAAETPKKVQNTFSRGG